MTHRRAFTLLELLISMTILVTMVTLVVGLLSNVLRNNRISNSRNQGIDRLRLVMTNVSLAIRQTRATPAGAYPIIAAENNSLTIYSSTDSTGELQRIRYFLDGSTLKRGLIRPVGGTYATAEVITILATGVQNGGQPLFQYYDKNYTGTGAAMNPIAINSIRYLTITVVFDDNPNELPGPVTLRFSAQLRNLKDNY